MQPDMRSGEGNQGTIMKLTINSRTLGKPVTFSRPGNTYIFVDMNGKPGTLGYQICEGGALTGSTIAYDGDSHEQFDHICRRWFKAHLRNLRQLGPYAAPYREI